MIPEEPKLPDPEYLARDAYSRFNHDPMFHARVVLVSRVLMPSSREIERSTRGLVALVLHANDEAVKMAFAKEGG